MKLLSIIAAVVASVALNSCNTFIGLGRDLKIAGEGLESSANKAGGSGGGESHDAGGAPVY